MSRRLCVNDSCCTPPGREPRRRGAAMVEFALLLPVLILILFGTIEVGRALDVQQILSQAAGSGARQASLGTQTNAQVRQAVLNYLSSAGIPTANAIVTVTDLTQPGLDVSQATQLDQVQVAITLPAGDITWTGTTLVISNTTLLTANCQYVSTCGLVYPSNVSVPPGY